MKVYIQSKRKHIDRYTVIIILIFSFANILNLFAGRGGVSGDMSEETGGVISRSYIQICYVLALFLMTLSIITKAIKPVLRPIVFLSLVVICNIFYWTYVDKVEYHIGIYIRLLTNFAALLFFYGINIKKESNRKVMQVFCLTALISQCFKIITSAVFSNELLGAGDTASIGIAFLIPLMILCFNPRTYMILIAFSVFFILLSVRRTSIIAIALSLMCYVNFKRIKAKHVITSILLMVGVLFYAHQYVGRQLESRFGVMISHDRSESIGSGREFFYTDLMASYTRSNGRELFLGKGLGSIYRHFKKKGNDYLNHAHNDYLEILYTFGLIGLLTWCVFVIKLFWIWKRANKTFEREVFLSAILGYLAISLLSGCLIRIEMLPFIFSLSILTPKMLTTRTS